MLTGVSCFFGLAVTCLFLPMNHFAGKVVVGAQDNLMKARDERIALMNEILGGIRMLKVCVLKEAFTIIHANLKMNSSWLGNEVSKLAL